jgi:flagellar protein FlbD
MIEVTRLNRTTVVINSDLIEQIESTPDTVITLTTGKTLMVLEPPETIIERVLGFRRLIVTPGSPGRRALAAIAHNPLAG